MAHPWWVHHVNSLEHQTLGTSCTYSLREANMRIRKILCGLLSYPNISMQVKAYTSRVGSGPFPTEILGKGGDILRVAGMEFGTTTGRPRRCGWLDIVALKFCCLINGFSSLNLTKLDVLSDLPEIKLGVSYKLIDGSPIESVPADLQVLEQLQAST